jgi:hypothetical protein
MIIVIHPDAIADHPKQALIPVYLVLSVPCASAVIIYRPNPGNSAMQLIGAVCPSE